MPPNSSSNYGAIGTNPLQPLPKTPEKLLADLLKSKYEQSMTGVKWKDIRWEQWFSGSGDISVFFQDAGKNNITNSVDHNLQEYDKFIDIHIFARSIKSGYEYSAERIIHGLENWIIKVITQWPLALRDKGILEMEYEDTRDLPYYMGDTTNYDNIINHKIISVRQKIMMLNQFDSRLPDNTIDEEEEDP